MVASPQSSTGISAISLTRSTQNFAFELDPASNTFAQLNSPSNYYATDSFSTNGRPADSQVTRAAAASTQNAQSSPASSTTPGSICSSAGCVAVMGSAVAGVALIALIAVGLFVYRRKRQLDQYASRVQEAPNCEVRIASPGLPKQSMSLNMKSPTLTSPPKATFAFSTSGGGRSIVKPAQGGNDPGWSMDLFSDTLSSDDDDDDGREANQGKCQADAVPLDKNLPSIPENTAVTALPPTKPKAMNRPPMIKVPASNFTRTPRPPSIVANYTVPPADNVYAKPMLSPITPLLSPPMHIDMGHAGAAVFGNTGYPRGGSRDSSGGKNRSYLQTGTGVGPRKLTLPASSQASHQRRSIDGVW